MIEIGRVCVKIAGRDAGKRCVVVDNIDTNFVLIDGETRRRKCNISHLEPLTQMVKISKGAAHEAVAKELGIKARSSKKKEVKPRPVKIRASVQKKAGKETAPSNKKAVKKKAAKKESSE